MPPQFVEVVPPSVGLWRLGRGPDPLDWPPRRPHPGRGRFDDPRNEFRTLYAAEKRLTCFIETAAGFRASIEWLAAARRVRFVESNDLTQLGSIPQGWLATRRIGHFDVAPGQRWLDLRAIETRIALRRELASELSARQLTDFDLSDALSREREVTQHVARWAYESGYGGIAYTSRFGCAFDCWVLFERVRFTALQVAAIADDDQDLAEVIRLFDLASTDKDMT